MAGVPGWPPAGPRLALLPCFLTPNTLPLGFGRCAVIVAPLCVLAQLVPALVSPWTSRIPLPGVRVYKNVRGQTKQEAHKLIPQKTIEAHEKKAGPRAERANERLGPVLSKTSFSKNNKTH